MDRVYLDYAATTPLEPRVLEAMTPYFTKIFGNPSSSHYFGQQAEGVLEECRGKVAKMLGARSEEVVFTASGSEGDNLALRGAAFSQRKNFGRDTLLISPVEHPGIAATARQLHDVFGFKIKELRIDVYGQIILEDLINKIDGSTALVSIVYANNEIGTINPVKKIASVCHEKGVIFHSDAVQACAHLPMNLSDDGIDLLSITAHKFYGPKGAGALIKHNVLELIAQTTGGKQEYNLRAGTHNVPGIVGLTSALEMTINELETENKRISALRDKLIQSIKNEIPGSHLTGHPTERMSNHASFVFEGVNGNDLVIMLDMAGFACSSGSACKVGDPQPSKMLLALGLKPELALGSLRITLGKYSTEDQIDQFLKVLPETIKKLRK